MGRPWGIGFSAQKFDEIFVPWLKQNSDKNFNFGRRLVKSRGKGGFQRHAPRLQFSCQADT